MDSPPNGGNLNATPPPSPTVPMASPPDADGSQNHNKKNLPQIQSENELIAQIVHGIRELAKELENSNTKLKPSNSSVSINNLASSQNSDLVKSSESTLQASQQSFLQELQTKDFTRETALKMEIPKLTPVGNPVEMKDFASRVFKQIRDLCNITTDSYVQSWNLPEESFQMKTGAGRSGSLFLSSVDKRYIFKTIPHDEVVAFLELLPHYFKHLVENPDSLIMRVFGLHRFKYAFNSYIYIIVFGNVLYSNGPSMDEIFDLKGRKPKPGKQGRNKGKTGIVFKDNDLDRRFSLGKDKAVYVKQLEADVKFLSDHNMMDYSFLVGVRKMTPNDPPTGEALQKGHTKFQGIPSAQSDELYYMGIIDCLTSYSSKKKAANFFKKQLWKEEELSTVDPPFYGSRFTKFMVDIFD